MNGVRDWSTVAVSVRSEGVPTPEWLIVGGAYIPRHDTTRGANGQVSVATAAIRLSHAAYLSFINDTPSRIMLYFHAGGVLGDSAA